MTLPWMVFAEGELGVEEIPGSDSNPRVEFYHGFTDSGEETDDVPWCSSFVCACFETVGIRSTRSKWARSWASWGVKIEKPQYGAVAVFKRGSGGHVGFVTAWHNWKLKVLGGNQSDMVCEKWYDRENLITMRMPEGWEDA